MAEQLKERFFTQQSINQMADAIGEYYPPFNKEKFLELIYDPTWKQLELKEKMYHTTKCLHQTLPENYGEAIAVLENAAPDVKGFEAMTLPDFVEQYGLDEDWEVSLHALRVFTRYSSSEFAIRPFLLRDPVRTVEFLLSCAKDQYHGVRRLASEGSRPRLPWAMALPEFKQDPAPIIPLLEQLKDDPSEIVRRSVANNLNDISKDNPEIALGICEEWYGAGKERDKIVKHACRTLLKAGNKRAMVLFGYCDPTHLKVENLKTQEESIKIGDHQFFLFDLLIPGNEKENNVRLEYAVYYMKANGKHSKKVFKITENKYPPGTHSFKRKQSFKNFSTRKHYAGEHQVGIIINGEEKAKISFNLSEA